MGIKSWIISKLDKLFQSTPEQKQKDFEKYKNMVYNNCIHNKGMLFGNFSEEGFYEIFTQLLQYADSSIYIICKNYDSIFNDDIFCYFKYVVKRINNRGGEISTITFDSTKDKRFIDLQEKYTTFNYYPMTLNTSKQANNCIIVNCKSYWLEEASTSTLRNGFTKQPFKACANFNDPLKAAKLISLFEKIRMIYLKDKPTDI